MEPDYVTLAKRVSQEDYKEEFCRFFQARRPYMDRLYDIVNSQEECPYHSYPIDVMELLDTNIWLGTYLIRHGQPIIDLLDEYILPHMQEVLLGQVTDRTGKGTVKSCKTRLVHLPCSEPPGKRSVSEIRNKDVGTLVSVSGTVSRTGVVKILTEESVCRCVKCSYLIRVVASPELHYLIDVPLRCPAGNYDNPKVRQFNPKAKRTKVNSCLSNQFEDVAGESRHTDFQEISVQEDMQNMEMGTIPRSMPVVLKDELVRKASPGDKVLITGTVMRRWRSTRKQKCEVELFIEANNIQADHKGCGSGVSGQRQLAPERIRDFKQFWNVYRSHPFQGRATLIDAICPALHGLPVPKLALLLCLISGCPMPESTTTGYTASKWTKYHSDTEPTAIRSEDALCSSTQDILTSPSTVAETPSPPVQPVQVPPPTATAVRSQCHVLFVGDAGTGKSQLLKRAAELTDRAVQATGLGCTAAGLTCAAVRDGPEWMLEAGAMVLADGGICCIDEFSAVRRDCRNSIHEAMEQQTISVAKAGIVCKLNTRCSVIAAANPTGSLAGSSGKPRTIPTNIPLPLLSRFDIIVILVDDLHDDACRARFILNKSTVSDENTPQKTPSRTSRPSPALHAPSGQIEWETDTLKDYVAYVRQSFHPSLTPMAQSVIIQYYTVLRQRSSAVASTATVRTLESIMRLCQAHARLLHRPTIEVEDVVAVVLLLESSLDGNSVAAESNVTEDDLLGGIVFKNGPPVDVHGPQEPEPPLLFDLSFDIRTQQDYLRCESVVLSMLRLTRSSTGVITAAHTGESPESPMSACRTPGPLTPMSTTTTVCTSTEIADTGYENVEKHLPLDLATKFRNKRPSGKVACGTPVFKAPRYMGEEEGSSSARKGVYVTPHRNL